ncbi:MAG: hypothetical protein JXB45_10995 [Candidatus Krumholzibacteriota bacterium]|nr:hypothetical protein [Candidatus Krumholzibacteriota bacterium]
MKKMKRKKLWLGLFLIFISGMIIGIAGSSILVRRHLKDFVRGGPPRLNRMIILEVTRDLELSEPQSREIERIMEESRPLMDKLVSAFGDSMRTLTTAQIDSIKKVLTEEQRKDVDKKLEEVQQRLSRLKDRHPGKREPDWRRGHHPGGRKDRRSDRDST